MTDLKVKLTMTKVLDSREYRILQPSEVTMFDMQKRSKQKYFIMDNVNSECTRGEAESQLI